MHSIRSKLGLVCSVEFEAGSSYRVGCSPRAVTTDSALMTSLRSEVVTWTSERSLQRTV